MFNEFMHQGSIFAVILMVYAGNVMMEAVRRDRLDPHGINSPLIIKHPISALFMFASIPCSVLPAIYIGSYSGWVAGIVSWLVLQIGGAVITIVLRVRGPLLGLHFIFACIAFPIGYFLSLSDLFA
ncbi:hypothetical protein C9J12_28750 [Photobacterium frigidiphilum]|uniref:Permease n=1 Tax=Photobacterium frigidiphilum TaxID=264736 RepID=A0A2T3J629_9GAMM|nr:hypothetical protein [Photobacterium frigidiphilum]PSU42621.1 hypothetical protein C9J12_28750 [Photobacterium frigidiphilum]